MGRTQFGSGGLGAAQQAVLPVGSGARGELGRAGGQDGELGGSREAWEDLVTDRRCDSGLLCWSSVGARGEEGRRAGGISAALGGL